MFMGQVLQAGAGQITARQAAVNAGIPMTVPATTVNKVCLSGLNTIYLADQMIQAGDADIVVAGGMESMTNAPYLLPGARAGYRIGDQTRRRLDDVRRPVLRLRPGRHGRRHREVRGVGRPRPRRRRTSSPPSPTSGPPGPPRTACSTTRSSPSRSPSARATRSSSPTTRASAARPPSSRSAGCARRSTRPATSPPATPRRSPTAAPR